MADVTFRVGLGRPLTYHEADENFRFVEEQAVNSATAAAASADASQSSISASQSAQSARDTAQAASTSASASEATAVSAKNASEDARDDAIAAAGAIGPIKFFDTYADAVAGISTIPEGWQALVLNDETQEGARTQYKVVDGSLELTINLDLFRKEINAPTGSAEVGHIAEGADASFDTVQRKLREWVSLESYGGKGDGTDDTSALEKAQAALPKGGVIRGLNGKRYFFPNGFTLQKGISFQGTWVPREDVGAHDPSSNSACLLLGANGKVLIGNGAEFCNWLVWRADLTAATSASDAASKVAGFTGTAVEAIGSDASAHHCTVIGFNQAFNANGFERVKFYENQFDCTNGVDVSLSYDISFVANNHGWPFFTVHRSWTTDALLRRSGTAYKIHGVADFIYVLNNFAYGYGTSYYLEDIAAGTVVGNKGDNTFSASAGCIGMETRGNMNNVVIDQNHIDSHDVNYRFAHTQGVVVGGANTSGQSHGPSYQAGPGSAGSFGSLAAAGTCQYVIDFIEGVSKWHIGAVMVNTEASSGVAYSFSNIDRLKIQIGFTSRINGSTLDNLGYGSSAYPSIRVSQDSNSGIFENSSDGSIGVSVNGLPACIFQPVNNAVNFAVVKPGATGQIVTIAAEGEANASIAIMPKGSGVVQLGASYSSGSIAASGYVTMYDAGGNPRRFLVG